MLAQTGDVSKFSLISTHGNQSGMCPTIAIRVVAASGLSDQQLSADLLDYFFTADRLHGCGDVDIDGYLNAADARTNGSTAVSTSGGDVIDTTDPSKTQPSSLALELPDGTSLKIG